MEPTFLYLVRHGATEANLASQPRLLGRRLDPPLAPVGILQAQAARDALATVPLQYCVTSPLLRARETAAIIAEPHSLPCQPLEALIEADLGRWEGLDWLTVQTHEPEAYERFQADPGMHGHPDGESYQDVLDRAWPALEQLLEQHPGEHLLAVSHQVVLRAVLTHLLGRPLARAREVKLANGSTSLVVRQDHCTQVLTWHQDSHFRNE